MADADTFKAPINHLIHISKWYGTHSNSNNKLGTAECPAHNNAKEPRNSVFTSEMK